MLVVPGQAFDDKLCVFVCRYLVRDIIGLVSDRERWGSSFISCCIAPVAMLTFCIYCPIQRHDADQLIFSVRTLLVDGKSHILIIHLYPLFVDGIGDLVLDDVFDDLLTCLFYFLVVHALRDKAELLTIVELDCKFFILQMCAGCKVFFFKDWHPIYADLEEAVLHFLAFTVVGVDRHRLTHRVVRRGKLTHRVDKIFSIRPLHRLPILVGAHRFSIQSHFDLHVLQAGLEGSGVPLLGHRNRFLFVDAVGDGAVVVDKVILRIAHPSVTANRRGFVAIFYNVTIFADFTKDLLVAERTIF